MDKGTLDTLEWPTILSQVQDRCFTWEGKLQLENQDFIEEEVALRTLKNQVKVFFDALYRTPTWPIKLCPPVSDILHESGPEGAVLDGRSLRDLGQYLSVITQLHDFLVSTKDPSLGLWIEKLRGHGHLASELVRHFDSEGNLQEDAVPALRALKKEMTRSHLDIEALAKSWLKGPEKELFQTDVPTQKDGRVVLPLKANFKGRIDGIFHDTSASGGTFFMEPTELVAKNNRLAEIHREYHLAVIQVLRDLTALVRKDLLNLHNLVVHASELDTYLSRALWGFDHKCHFPEIIPIGRGLKLPQARHPLLGERAVPITLEIPPGTRALLISGPNTGGKTVTLKTAALLSLMHQWGLPIPAQENAQLPLWKSIWSDIGDGQSLSENLSTFSSHLKRMVKILENADQGSLILLDELGTGTDPLEGGALAMTFLEELTRRHSLVLVTTHHGALKNHAYTQEGYRNASVEFDETTHRPTYRILTDVPGSSHALDIAQTMGIPGQIIEKARSLLDKGQSDVTKIIQTLKEKQGELFTREQELSKKEKQFYDEKRKSDLIVLRARQKEHELRTYGVGDIRQFLQTSRKHFESLVKEIREGQLNPEKIKEVRAFFQTVENQVEVQSAELESQEESFQDPREPLGTLVPGLEVILEPSGNRGVLERPTGKDAWVMTVGNIRMTVKASKIRRIVSPGERKSKVEIHTSEVAAGAPAVFSLDLRGCRLDEALEKLQIQVDRALLSGLKEFSVIHGHGEGVLQKGVQDYLRSRREVKKYFFSSPDEGGFGKTIVQL